MQQLIRTRYLEREFLIAYQNSHIVLLRPVMSELLKFTRDSELDAIKVRTSPLTNGIT